MCGISGFIGVNGIKGRMLDLLHKMTEAIAHRGPDGSGHWISEDNRIALGHRRLSIIDLSHEADQPMHYMNRYTIVFNGEIYNYLELRSILINRGYTFKTKSDTEVLMALYDLKKEDCLSELDGMFSFVIYDNHQNTVFCARDRFGEKPFFYTVFNGGFYFGSEIKCFKAIEIPCEPNLKMVYNYLTEGHVNDISDPSRTFFETVFKLKAAHFIKFNINELNAFTNHPDKFINRYWDIDLDFERESISNQEAISGFQHLLTQSVQRRLRSDVPVGSSLSGGLDSSLIACIIDDINKENKNPVQQNTFSARFPGYSKDEGGFMKLITEKTGAQAFYTFPNENGFIEDFEKLNFYQEEPYVTSSIYAQYCVMGLAKENNVTVLLDGQGADEILAGYHYYYDIYFRELEKFGGASSKKLWQDYYTIHSDNNINRLAKKGIRYSLKKYAPGMIHTLKGWSEAYNQFRYPTLNKEFYNEYKSTKSRFSYSESLKKALWWDTTRGSLENLLRYCDRNSMANSREVRLPFLSHELVEFVFSLPSGLKIKDGWTKWILRKSYENMLPKEIAWRKDKIGYEPPQKTWLGQKKVLDLVHDAFGTLKKEHLLNKNAEKFIQQQPDAVKNDLQWKYLMVAGLLFNNK